MKYFFIFIVPILFSSLFITGCLKMENAILGTIMDWEINSSGLTQKNVNVDGIDLVYFEGGKGTETIVLLHD